MALSWLDSMSIALIGMSNLGKSHWALKLDALGYTRVCVDDEIEKLLAPYLVSQGYSGIADVSRWMGQPYDPQFKKHSAIYLQFERQVMWRVVWRMLKGEKLVVDTTGSVIYCGWPMLSLLWLLGTVVLLDAPESHQQELFEKYIAEPKPVLWGDNTYRPYHGEEPKVALARCYPELLRTRNQRYKRWAQVTLDYFELRRPGFGVGDFNASVWRQKDED